MNLKSFVRSMCGIFFIVVTLINLAAFVLGSVYRPQAQFGYGAFLAPLVEGFLGILPACVMYSRKELTFRQILFRKVLQFILLEALMMWFVFGHTGFSQNNLEQIISLALTVFVVFLLVHVISFALDARQAKEMTRDLLEYQKKE